MFYSFPLTVEYTFKELSEEYGVSIFSTKEDGDSIFLW
jgi:hypothetical protein